MCLCEGERERDNEAKKARNDKGGRHGNRRITRKERKRGSETKAGNCGENREGGAIEECGSLKTANKLQSKRTGERIRANRS